MSPDQTQNLFEYIALLKSTNEQLLATLKKTVTLLAQFTDSVPEPKAWQEMLDVSRETIKAGERAGR